MVGSLLYKRLVPLNLLFVLLCITNIAYAGISMISPCARFSPMGINCPSLPKYQSWDKQMNKPISVVPYGYAKPMCKHTAPWPVATEHWVAGTDVTVQFTADAGSVGGGFCQFSLSYDNGDSFVVIHEVLDTCFQNSQNPSDLVTSYTFKLPNNLPSIDMAIFAWTYANSTQESSFYMNCGDVSISGSSSTEFTGREMTLVNYPGYPQIYPDIDGISTGSSFYTDNVVYLTVTAIDENEANILKKRAKDDEENNEEENGQEGNSENNPEEETETETDTSNQGNVGAFNALADDDKCEEEPLLLADSSSEDDDNETDSSKSQSPSEAGMDGDKCDDATDEPTDELDGDKCDDETDEPTDDLDDDKCDDETDDPTDDLDDDKCDDQTDDSSSESSSDSSSNSSSDSLSDSSSGSSSNSLSELSSEPSSEPSSNPSEMGDLDSASSESSDSSDSSEPSSTDFAYPVIPTNEPDLMCDTLSNSPVVNFYMQNIYASYGYLTETSVADSLTEGSSSEEPSSVSSSTETPEPTISSGDSKNGDENNNVVNISIN